MSPLSGSKTSCTRLGGGLLSTVLAYFLVASFVFGQISTSNIYNRPIIMTSDEVDYQFEQGD